MTDTSSPAAGCSSSAWPCHRSRPCAGGALADAARPPRRSRRRPRSRTPTSPTPELTEGPYFKPSSPLRRSIVPAGAPGTRLTLTGRVLTTAAGRSRRR